MRTRCAQSVLSRPLADMAQYGPRAWLIKMYIIISLHCLGTSQNSGIAIHYSKFSLVVNFCDMNIFSKPDHLSIYCTYFNCRQQGKLC